MVGAIKPILYDQNETEFKNNGHGVLSDCISCVITEERNGMYELVMQYHISGIHYDQINQRSILLCKPNTTGEPEPFRVYRITKPINGIVTIYAAHISYDLSGIPVSPFSADSAAAAMSGLQSFSVIDNPFTFWTDKEKTGTFSVSVPSSVRSLMGGSEGSILDVFGGEYSFTGYIVRLHNNRGENRGVKIKYGKNLTSLQQDENCANVYTGVYPYWTNGEVVVGLPEKIVKASGQYAFERILPLDLSSEFDEQPTEDQLREATQNYISKNKIGIPTVSLDVSFVQLEQTEEYKNLALIDRVMLCDEVTVEFPALCVEATAKCVKTEYDALLERYKSVTLGEARTNIANTLAEQKAEIAKTPTVSSLQAAINNATSIITGNKGGYVVMHSSTGAKQPDEILIMDSPDIATAVNVWRWNKSGLGYSSTGYNGPYGLAMTHDGQIVADFITTGSMSANRITAGVLSSIDGRFNFDLTANTITLVDEAGDIKLGFDTLGNLTISGAINATSGKIGAFSIDAEGNLSGVATLRVGDMTMAGNKINGLLIGENNLDYVSGQPSGDTDVHMLGISKPSNNLSLFDLYIDSDYVTVYDVDGNMVDVVLHDGLGFAVSNPGAAPSSGNTARVIIITSDGHSLKRRSAPNTSSAILGYCYTGDVYGYDSLSNDWAHCTKHYIYDQSTGKYIESPYDTALPFYCKQHEGGKTYFNTGTINL